jgi:hypothetical protein
MLLAGGYIPERHERGYDHWGIQLLDIQVDTYREVLLQYFHPYQGSGMLFGKPKRKLVILCHLN